MPRPKFRKRSSSLSYNSDDSRPSDNEGDKELEPAVLVYHESARDIVFRDHVRREATSTGKESSKSKPSTIAIANKTPLIKPLAPLELGQIDKYKELEDSSNDDTLGWTEAEREVVKMLREQRAVIKTVKNADWTSFLRRFRETEKPRRGRHDIHADIPPKDHAFCFNTFVTSTSLLPELGKKMRCFGSIKEYGTGVVFALPTSWGDGTEDEATKQSNTWSWPSGYSAKTEFNIDRHGNLINGRQEAIVPLSGLREHNHAYIYDEDYEVGGKMIQGGLKTVPFNEVYIRVGGLGRIVNGKDCATGEERSEKNKNGRSFQAGNGLPVALFVRSAQFGHLISLLRTRARVSSIIGGNHINDIPLLFITPELGVRVLTEELEKQLLKTVTRNLNPFQNPNLAYKTTVEDTSEKHLEQKLEELIDLDSDNIKNVLTPAECARLAGGFGATDDSVANLLMGAMEHDKTHHGKEAQGSTLQDIVNEGLAAAVRSGDYHTSRQLLILYTLVASKGFRKDNELEAKKKATENNKLGSMKRLPSLQDLVSHHENQRKAEDKLAKPDPIFVPPPPPPPLDTDRLRSATNSDGLLAVLGAAEILKSMQDGSSKCRTMEVLQAIEEWVEHGEHNVAFRVASWKEQRASQSDLKINMKDNSEFLAFVGNKATVNRKKFAQQLRQIVNMTSFEDISFLRSIYSIVSKMHSPCLRLELLQYLLGLDNRYSVAHVARSVELAATCMSMSAETSDGDSPVSLLTTG